MTFYPGIWRITDQKDNEYELIQSTNVTFNPSGTSSNTYPCQNYTLSDRDRFIAPSGSVIGLYSNRGVSQPLLLHTDDDMDNSVKAFQFNGNQSNVNYDKDNENNEEVDYNIAIRVHLSK